MRFVITFFVSRVERYRCSDRMGKSVHDGEKAAIPRDGVRNGLKSIG